MITTKQRAFLKSLASKLDPVFQVGKGGVSEEQIKAIDDYLRKHEIVKIKVLDNSLYTAREAAEEIAASIKAEVVQVIGSRAVFFKRNAQKPVIELPSNKNKKTSSNRNNDILIDDFELSDEEREERNKNFQQRFDQIADSRLVKTTQEELNSEETSKNYNNYVSIDDEDDSYYFAYDNDDKNEEITPQDIDDDINDIPIAKYQHQHLHEIDENVHSYRSSYILIHKARCLLGTVMLLLMLIETTTMLVIFKLLNMQQSDKILFIIAYVLIIISCARLIIPVFINPNKRKLNNFKFGYSLILSILSFVVLSILTYAINTFIGLDFSNIQYFYTKLFLPIMLCFNLVLGTIVYKIISVNKKLY